MRKVWIFAVVPAVIAGFGLWNARPARTAPSAPGGRIVYENDFEKEAGPEWNSRRIDETPEGKRRFLGQFDGGTVTLSLDKLPTHTEITLSFDLFLIRSWDGSRSHDPAGVRIGPDLWGLRVDKGATLVNTTFALYDGYEEAQAYPGTFPGDRNPIRSGAFENNTLGYTFAENPDTVRPMDCVVPMQFTFPHTSRRLRLYFWGAPSESAATESWGLDNVRVVVRTR